MFRSCFFKCFLIILVVFIFAAIAYVFAASNVVPSSKVGEGAGTIADYLVSNVQYVLNSSDPRNIDQVKLTLNAAAATVKVKVVNWYACTLISANNWVCSTTSPQVSAQSAVSGGQLRVIAVQ